MSNNNRFCWEVRPVALAENTVQGENWRFTVLTPCLIRMEFDDQGIFEDRASQMVFYRDLPKCDFTVNKADGYLVLRTDALELKYQMGQRFGEETLCVKLLNEPASAYHYGEEFEDLGGTAKTLDFTSFTCPVDHGVCSRNGFSVLDDSNTVVLEDDGSVGVRRDNSIDAYFFGYGFDYLGAVKDFYRITGAPPLLPAYALGNWWSRYYAYTQQAYLELMDRFKEEDLPFSVSVVDMDWHIVQIPEEERDEDPRLQTGWTGYTWNKALFPDYKAFLQELHKRNLKTALNLHPAAGTRRHEEMYEQMAIANGIDPASGKRVPLDILSQDHMATYFDILHHPYEKDGVDFWWMDWQQGTDYWWIHERNAPGTYQDPRERMDPLWMLNHLHILDIMRDGKRPMFFSRYSGPGSHRYPVGFSGDTFTGWDALNFQPGFTATASNIGYGWWSHDIGGHMRGCRDDMRYIRWVQLGVFSPINRLHSSNMIFIFKEPWKYPEPIRSIAGKYLRLRHQLFPYLYTMNYRCHNDLQPLVQPMYYHYPKKQAAYMVRNQFFFGSELLVAPITSPNNETTGMGMTDVWLPKGDWFDFFAGLHYTCKTDRNIKAYRGAESMPVFAKAGAIVPMAQHEKYDNRLVNRENMEVLVFPGAANSFDLYEDAGEGQGYRDGENVVTHMQLDWSETPAFTIAPARGDLRLIPEVRNWRIGLRGFHNGIDLRVLINGKEVDIACQQDGYTLWVSVQAPVTAAVTLQISGQQLITDNPDVIDRCARLMESFAIRYGDMTEIWRYITEPGRLLSDQLEFMTSRFSDPECAKALYELLSLSGDGFIGVHCTTK